MRVEFINPFLEAADHVFGELLSVTLSRGRLSMKMPDMNYPQVSIVLGVVGQVHGQVIYGSSYDTAKAIASKMMMGAPVDSLNDMARSALAELGNMITGQATMGLEHAGFRVDISPPTIITGTDIRIATPKTQILLVPLEHPDLGKFEIHVGLEER